MRQIIGVHALHPVAIAPAADRWLSEGKVVKQRTRRNRGRLTLRRIVAAFRKLPDIVHFNNNRVALLPHGGDFFPALFQAIESARCEICSEFYIIRADATGRAFARALTAAARRGVSVSLLYDAIGCYDTPSAYFQELTSAGVRCLAFNSPAISRLPWLDRRNHRKMVVIDGAVAFLGGLNVGDEYAGFGEDYHRWRDVGLTLEGPAVAELRRQFGRSWAEQGGSLPDAGPFSPPAPRGEADVVIVNGTPHHTRSIIRSAFRLAMAGAGESIRIMTPYFLPGPRVVRSLLLAVRRGVGVELILPSVSDVPLIKLLGRVYLKPLQKAGVAIYERQDTILHAKVMLIDDRWVMLGSANLDYRSFHRNYELNVIIESHEFGGQVGRLFSDELGKSRPVSAAQLAWRSWGQRLLAWLLSPLRRYF